VREPLEQARGVLGTAASELQRGREQREVFWRRADRGGEIGRALGRFGGFDHVFADLVDGKGDADDLRHLPTARQRRR
jgi:hypothetical protein